MKAILGPVNDAIRSRMKVRPDRLRMTSRDTAKRIPYLPQGHFAQRRVLRRATTARTCSAKAKKLRRRNSAACASGRGRDEGGRSVLARPSSTGLLCGHGRADRLRKVAAYHGRRAHHAICSEGTRLLEGIDEVIKICREAKLPCEIYHLKAAGPTNWKKMTRPSPGSRPRGKKAC